MDFKDYLDKSAKEIDRKVEKILNKEIKEAKKIDKKLVPLLEVFAACCMGGKRIRGTLVKLGYDIAQSVILRAKPEGYNYILRSAQNDIIKVAAAYEIMHAAILAHDDIIDQSLIRRGHPSLYQALGAGQYGISQAISLGDLGFFLSIKIISESKFPEKEKVKALNYFSKIMMDTSLGEMLELEDGDVLTTAKLKTARYTISGPLIMGIILGGGNGKIIRQLEVFGENLGIAYQIKDDILDKDGYYKGGLVAAKKEAEKYKNKAMKILPSILKDKKMSKLLEQMAEYLVERKR